MLTSYIYTQDRGRLVGRSIYRGNLSNWTRHEIVQLVIGYYDIYTFSSAAIVC